MKAPETWGRQTHLLAGRRCESILSTLPRKRDTSLSTEWRWQAAKFNQGMEAEVFSIMRQREHDHLWRLYIQYVFYLQQLKHFYNYYPSEREL